jgi:ATP-dependent HslUV protease subunit HslV
MRACSFLSAGALRRSAVSAPATAGLCAPTAAAFATLDARRWTTILSVRKNGVVVLMGDKQVTLGERIVAKATAKKLRRVDSGKGEPVIVGFAGSTADAITLLEKLEGKLNEFPNQLQRAAVELAKDWRSDKILRRLEASLVVCDAKETLEIDGQGNVITCEADGVVAIGSGGTYAKAAARALVDIDGLSAEDIAAKAMKIATDIDVFSNGNFDKEIIKFDVEAPSTSAAPTPSTSTSSSGDVKP